MSAATHRLVAVVIICGGRDTLPFPPAVTQWLDAQRTALGIGEVVDGGNQRYDAARRCWRGADYHGRLWAQRRGLVMTTFWANWGGEGRAAGPRRNVRMRQYLLDRGRLCAILALPGGAGTAHMVQLGKESAIPVYSYEEDPQ